MRLRVRVRVRVRAHARGARGGRLAAAGLSVRLGHREPRGETELGLVGRRAAQTPQCGQRLDGRARVRRVRRVPAAPSPRSSRPHTAKARVGWGCRVKPGGHAAEWDSAGAGRPFPALTPPPPPSTARLCGKHPGVGEGCPCGALIFGEGLAAARRRLTPSAGEAERARKGCAPLGEDAAESTGRPEAFTPEATTALATVARRQASS